WVGEQPAEGMEVAFRKPQRMEAIFVGEPRDLGDELVLAVLRRFVLRVVAEEVDAEVRHATRLLGDGGRVQRHGLEALRRCRTNAGRVFGGEESGAAQ